MAEDAEPTIPIKSECSDDELPVQRHTLQRPRKTLPAGAKRVKPMETEGGTDDKDIRKDDTRGRAMTSMETVNSGIKTAARFLGTIEKAYQTLTKNESDTITLGNRAEVWGFFSWDELEEKERDWLAALQRLTATSSYYDSKFVYKVLSNSVFRDIGLYVKEHRSALRVLGSNAKFAYQEMREPSYPTSTADLKKSAADAGYRKRATEQENEIKQWMYSVIVQYADIIDTAVEGTQKLKSTLGIDLLPTKQITAVAGMSVQQRQTAARQKIDSLFAADRPKNLINSKYQAECREIRAILAFGLWRSVEKDMEALKVKADSMLSEVAKQFPDV